MARRKRRTSKVRRVTRSSTFRKKSRSTKKLPLVGTNGAIQIPSMVYGAGRSYLSNLIAPYTSKLPFGAVADEVGMSLVAYFAAKNTKGFVKDVAMKALTIENARVGEALADGSALTFMAKDKSTGQPLQATIF